MISATLLFLFVLGLTDQGTNDILLL